MSRSLAGVVTPVATVTVGAIVLEALTRAGVIPAFVLPAPSRVFAAVVREFPAMVPHLIATVQATAVGLALALVAAVGLAAAMSMLSPVRRALYPLIVVSQTVPLIALAPLFVLWFGFGLLPKVLVVALVCFFPIVVSLVQGIDAVDERQVSLLRSMGAGRTRVFRYVHLPASIPSLFGGLRISTTYSVMGAVIGEWLGGSTGLGVYMIRAQRAFALERLFAAVLVVILLSFAFFAAIVVMQRIAMPWRRPEASSTSPERSALL